MMIITIIATTTFHLPGIVSLIVANPTAKLRTTTVYRNRRGLPSLYSFLATPSHIPGLPLPLCLPYVDEEQEQGDSCSELLKYVDAGNKDTSTETPLGSSHY